MADPGGAGYGMVTQVPAEVDDRRGGLTADRVSFLPVASPTCDRSLGNEDDEHKREVDMPRRGIAVAVIVIVACFIVLGLTSDFLVDWAWFSAIGYLDVFGTILGGKAVLFFAVFAGSSILLWGTDPWPPGSPGDGGMCIPSVLRRKPAGFRHC